MASREEVVTELVSGGSTPLRIRFFWVGDRFRHELLRGDTCCLRSVESGDDEWPDTPPLQQLHVEQRKASEVVLAVGMAGKSHWSLSVERSPEEDGFVFDYACLVKTSPLFLGSTYEQLHEGIELAALNSEEDQTQRTSVDNRQTIQLLDLPTKVTSPVTKRWRFIAQ